MDDYLPRFPRQPGGCRGHRPAVAPSERRARRASEACRRPRDPTRKRRKCRVLRAFGPDGPGGAKRRYIPEAFSADRGLRAEEYWADSGHGFVPDTEAEKATFEAWASEFNLLERFLLRGLRRCAASPPIRAGAFTLLLLRLLFGNAARSYQHFCEPCRLVI